MTKDPEEQELVPPAGTTVDPLELAGQTLMVISFPVRTRPGGALSGLSEAEASVARLAADGRSNAEIADARGTSVRTVANQMAAVLRKLRMGSRHELMVRLAVDGAASLPTSGES